MPPAGRPGLLQVKKTSDFKYSRAGPTEAGVVLASRGRGILADTAALLASVRVGSGPSGPVQLVLPAGRPPEAIGMLEGPLLASSPRSSSPFASPMIRSRCGWAGSTSRCYGRVTSECPRLTRAYLDEQGTPVSLEALGSHDLPVWKGVGQELEDAGRIGLPLLAGGELTVKAVVVATGMHMLRQIPEELLREEKLVPALADQLGGELPLNFVIAAATAHIPRTRAIPWGSPRSCCLPPRSERPAGAGPRFGRASKLCSVLLSRDREAGAR